MVIKNKKKVIDRLMGFVDNPDKNKYWIFTGAKRNGYGAININGLAEGAHRVSYATFVGDVPDDLMICHACDTPACINPDHLFLGTRSDNMKDAWGKGRLNIPRSNLFIKGHLPSNACLTEQEARKLKNIIANRGKVSLKEISKKFKISYQTIRDISSGRRYINV